MLSKVLASLLLVYKNSVGLILSPYRTMRSIAASPEMLQIIWIMAVVVGYLVMVGDSRTYLGLSALAGLMVVISATNRLRTHSWNIFPTLGLFFYSLIPTLVWFSASQLLNAVFPPPRTTSISGKFLSLLYIAFSISVLFWKVLVTFLAIRFSGRYSFYIAMGIFIGYTLVILAMIASSLQSGWLSVPFL